MFTPSQLLPEQAAGTIDYGFPLFHTVHAAVSEDYEAPPHEPGELTDEMWRRYREGIEPLMRASKLIAVHFQFAP